MELAIGHLIKAKEYFDKSDPNTWKENMKEI